MTLWICVGVVVLGLGILLVLLLEVRAKQRRLTASLGDLQVQAERASTLVGSLQDANASLTRRRAPELPKVHQWHTPRSAGDTTGP